MKQIILIRHGESLGQTARENGLDRQKDPKLTDCFLSQRGIHQAFSLQSSMSRLHQIQNFDLICVSPLTRAVATCTLGFGHLYEEVEEDDGSSMDTTMEDLEEGKKNNQENTITTDCRQNDTSNERRRLPSIICHPDIAETGGRIPENRARPIKAVKKTLKQELTHHVPNVEEFVESIDFSLLPQNWPRSKTYDGQIAYFLEWLNQRPESNIAVVCHYNVIRALLRHQIGQVYNCQPIKCFMVDDDVRTLYLESHLDSRERVQTKKKGKGKKKNKNNGKG